MRWAAMTRVSPSHSARAKLVEAWRGRALSLKAASFAAVGVVNTAVDFCVFLLARALLTHSATALAVIGSFSAFCRCGDTTAMTLVASNLISWAVAVSGSYIMNSSITFAVESGQRLRWRDYLTFVASGIAGWLANTATLVIAVEVLLLPIWLAKAVAILASFMINFSLSHFIVFRARPEIQNNVRQDGDAR
jgi:putative flippase GtrA